MSDENAVSVLSTTAFKTTLEALASEFERLSGKRLVASFGPSVRISERLVAGEAIDVVLIADEGVDQLIARGVVSQGSRIDIARSDIAVAVVAGAKSPDVSSVERFKQALLDAKSIALSNPAGGGRSGLHMQSVLEQLDLVDVLKPKIVYGGGGPQGLISLLLANGKAELGIQQKPELMAVPGIDVVGPLPGDLQSTTVFSIGTPVLAQHRDAASVLTTMLRTSAGIDAMRANGLEPV